MLQFLLSLDELYIAKKTHAVEMNTSRRER